LKVALGTASKGEENIAINKNKPVVNIYLTRYTDLVNVNITGVVGTSEIHVYDFNGVRDGDDAKSRFGEDTGKSVQLAGRSLPYQDINNGVIISSTKITNG